MSIPFKVLGRQLIGKYLPNRQKDLSSDPQNAGTAWHCIRNQSIPTVS